MGNEKNNQFASPCHHPHETGAKASRMIKWRIRDLRRDTMAGPLPAGEITNMLADWAAGRPERRPELWTAVYRELRQIASAYMRNERPDHTLQTSERGNQ